jgi:outer membrane lipoprotein SlyB
MNTDIQQSRRIHPLVLAAAICVMLFSLLGSAALMGWLPTSHGDEDSDKLNTNPAAELNAKEQPAAKTEQRAALPVSKAAPKAPAKRESTRVVLSSTHGVVDSIREVSQKGEGSGIGAVAGGVAGGVLGHQIGGGHGKDAMTVVGVLGGGLAGHEIEKRVRATKSYVIDVRFDDGSTRSFTRSELPPFNVGDRVRLVDGALRSEA